MIDYVTREQFDVFLRDEAEHHAKDEAYMHKVEVSVAAVGQQVAGLGTQIVASQRLIEKHHKDLYGNGEVGMDEQIRIIVAWIKKQDEKQAAKEKEELEAKKWWRSQSAQYVFFLITFIISEIVLSLLGK